MKQFFIILTALFLTLSLAACGPDEPEKETETPSVPTQVRPEVPTDLPTLPTEVILPNVTEPPASPIETTATSAPTVPSEAITEPSVTEPTGGPVPPASEPVPSVTPLLPTDPEVTGPTIQAPTAHTTPSSTDPVATTPAPNDPPGSTMPAQPDAPTVTPSAPTVHPYDPPQVSTPSYIPGTVPSVTQPPVTAPTTPSATTPVVTVPPVTQPPVTAPTAPPATTPVVTVPPVTQPPVTAPTAPPATTPVVTVPPVTQPPVTAPTAPPATTPAITDPPATNPPATFPVQTEPVFTDCPHHYDLIDILPATCVSSEIQVYRCSQCSGTEHRAVSEPLGHRFNLRAICTRCGEADPGPIELIIIVKDKKNNKLPGVTVHVFFDGTEVATGTTDTKGEARVYVDRLQTYQVTLSDLPANIIANSSYTFSSKQASIPLAIQPIRDPLDHSLADYQKGSTMADFTLTDSDGNLYQLYDLLAEKKLVILDFWYCSCTPCKKEFPYFDAALDRYGSQIELLALNPLDSLENILSIRQELGSKFPMLRDTVNLYKGFAVTSYPVTVFIGSDGQILAIHNGAYDSQEQLFKDISKYLK